MAIKCSFPHFAISGGDPVRKSAAGRAFMLPNRSSTTLIGSFTVNKVFEDQTRRIICYRDDCGEIICEGYDEGPRFCQQAFRTVCHQRKIQVLDFLHKGLQILEDAERCCSKPIPKDLDYGS